ncbi:MAG: type I pullulanase [Bacilli bacterium]|jgi:pullulanase
MKDSFIVAKLIDYKTIRLVLFTNALKDDIDYTLTRDGELFLTLKLTKANSMHGLAYYEFHLDSELELGHDYQIVLANFGAVNLDVNDLTLLDDFDERFAYDGDDLGPTYEADKTTFALWAPLASKVFLRYHFDAQEIEIKECTRDKKGVYRTTLIGDNDLLRYTYLITNSGLSDIVSDPYAKSSTLNSKESVVVNLKKNAVKFHDDLLPKMDTYCDAIIYEGHVRDLTISAKSDIVHKGTFKGLCEEGRKTEQGHPAGLDYIKFLGITHLQLLPILDYATVDETKPLKSYNWGYDPCSFFSFEGSYASEMDNPYSRINDFKELVSTYHKHGIRIILDVVFNHVYQYQFSILNRIVPNYFFRRKENGKLSECSGCGNDFMSEREMARKLIVDSCSYLIKEFHIDGFRFDLMGLLDISTLKEIDEKCHKLKKDIMLYGEGWEMHAIAKGELLGTMYHADILPHYAFFNDRFREIVKGGCDNRILEKGYALDNSDYRQGLKFALLGSSLNYTYPRLFNSPCQSINYIECHDNGTLFDKLQSACIGDEIDDLLTRQNFANSLVMLSFGIPFFHAGQEIGFSKKHRTNTYNDISGVNTFDYSLLDKHFSMAKYFSVIASLRKSLPFLRCSDPDKIAEMVEYKDLPNNGLLIDFNKRFIAPFSEFKAFINPSDETIYYDQDKYYQMLISLDDKKIDVPMIKNAMIKPMSILLLFSK